MGRFITFEGGEGTGKSTQVQKLVERLAKEGIEAVKTREPGGAPGAEAIRKLLVEGETARWDALTEALLHTAARRDHLEKTVRPALARGAWVISDRYVDSTIAYQGFGHGLPVEDIRRLHRLANGGFMPAMTFILDLPVEAGLARAARRGGAEDRYERMDKAFHERLRKGFLAQAEADPERCQVIDAFRDVEIVHETIWNILAEKFPLR
jgi:dTMP kinase